MENRKRTVDELNELAYKMTGVNPKATTDAGALNYIEQNYQGGGSGGEVEEIILDISTDASDFDNLVGKDTLIEDETFYLELDALIEKVYSGKNVRVMLVRGDGIPFEAKVYRLGEDGIILQGFLYSNLKANKLPMLTITKDERQYGYAIINAVYL